MNKLMTLISLVVGVGLALLGATSFAQGPGNQAMGWRPIEASWLIGQRVNGRASNYIGQISNLVIDQANDRVALVVLSDVPGFGADQVAIPYGCLERNDNHAFTIRFPIMATASVNNREDPDIYLLRQYLWIPLSTEFHNLSILTGSQRFTEPTAGRRTGSKEGKGRLRPWTFTRAPN